MQRFTTLIALVIGFTFVGSANAAQSNAPSLNIGDLLPDLFGQTLTGKALSLPGAIGDKPAVLVFSFSRKAATDARLWNEHLLNDFGDVIAIYGIIELESAPKLFRGMAISGIKSSMPLSAQDRTIVLYQDEKLWKQHLAVSDDGHAYVILLGQDGRVLWMNSGSFADSEYALLKSHLSGLLQLRP